MGVPSGYTSAQVVQAVPTGINSALVHITTLTMTAVASASVNNCFTSTYENYRIIGSFTASTGSGNVTMKLRASSTDTSANYKSQLLQAYSTTVSTSDTGTGELYVVSFNTTGKSSSFAMDVYRPQTAQITAMSSAGFWVDGSGVLSMQSVVGTQNSSTQFDGFTILWGSTNITGTVRVYGYLNS